MNPAPVVVCIEDEREIRRFLRTALEAAGCSVFEAEKARDGLIEAATRKPDLVLLDLGLPDCDGIQVVHEIRQWSNRPILVLTARVGEKDKVEALDAGADDYLTKPFSIAELLARVRALLRRSAQGSAAESYLRFGDVEVDLIKRLVTRAGVEVHLTPIEYRLLAQLLANAGRVMTHRQLLREVWGPSHSEHAHYLRVYMAGLRRKLEANPTNPQHIRTESGVGYRLVI